MKRATPCLLFLVVVSCLLLFTLVPRYHLLEHRANDHSSLLHRRQIIPSFATPSSTPSSSTPPSASTTPTSTSTTPTSTSTPPSTTQQPTSTTQPTSTPPSSTTAPSITPTSSSSSSSVPASTASLTSTPVVGTQTFTTTLRGSSTSSSSPISSAGSSNTSSSSSGLGTGSIIGLSVAGGVAVIGVVAFFIWKFTRKRFVDFDDNEAIKWPELNSHGGESASGHALPTHATGRAGFGDDNDGGSTFHGGYAASLGATSTPDLHPGAGPDPYAVPPLPHLNPNQPYRDEPGLYGQDPSTFYDPYRGPVPNTLNEAGMEGAQVQGGTYGSEAIPMTQMARTRSPGPQIAYEMGRQSPQSAMGRQSPGPQASLGRQSPGPQMAYGDPMMEAPGRLPSPGPHTAYGGYDDGYGRR